MYHQPSTLTVACVACGLVPVSASDLHQRGIMHILRGITVGASRSSGPTAVSQGALGSTQAPSALAATTGPDKAYEHGQGMKAHGAAALQGTGSALSHAKEALQEKMAARKYEKYERVRLHDPSSTPLHMKQTVPAPTWVHCAPLQRAVSAVYSLIYAPPHH